MRQDAHKRPKLESSWRRPRGLHSKMRLKRRGYALPIATGRRHPLKSRSLVNGLEPVQISTIAEMDSIEPKVQVAVIASTVGGRKREQLLLRAKERGVAIFNVQDVDGHLKRLLESLASRRKVRQQRLQEKRGKEKKAVAKAAPPVKKELSDEEKKDAEKTEKEKVLTKGM